MNDTSSEKISRNVRESVRSSRLARSGWMTVLVLAVLLSGLASLRLIHVKNKMNELTAFKQTPETVPSARPGDRDLIHLTRLPITTSLTPEFLSSTLAPGVGMTVLQMTVTSPDHGEEPLLLSTPPENLIKAGKAIVGAGFLAEVETRDGGRWSAPKNILEGRPTDTVTNTSLPDGGEASALFPAVSPASEAHPMNTMGVETKVSTNMSGHAVEMTLSARNTSDSPRGVVLAWEPRFLAPANGGLQRLSLLPPMSDANHVGGETRAATPIPLGTTDVDVNLTGLRRSYLSNGPELDLRNEASGYMLKITALSPSIRSLRIQAPRGGSSVLVSFSTAEAPGTDAAPTIVQPGETLQWRIRMEVTASATYQQPLE